MCACVRAGGCRPRSRRGGSWADVRDFKVHRDETADVEVLLFVLTLAKLTQC